MSLRGLVPAVWAEEHPEHIVRGYRVLVVQSRSRATYKVSERGAAIGRQGVVPGSLEGQEREVG
jgi:hypothetical protein